MYHKCSWDAKKPIVQVLWRGINFYGEDSSSLLIYLTSEIQFNSLIHRHWDLSMTILSKGAVCFFLLIFTFLYHEHPACHIRNMSRPGFWLCWFFFPFWWQLIWGKCFISCFVLAIEAVGDFQKGGGGGGETFCVNWDIKLKTKQYAVCHLE